MTDPTYGELIDAVREQFPDADEADTEEAIYWFAADYHGGQWSNLYSVLCSAKFRPGHAAKHVTKGRTLAREIYSALADQFGCP